MGSKLSKKKKTGNENNNVNAGQLFRKDPNGNAIPVSENELTNIAAQIRCPPPRLQDRPYHENRQGPVMHRNFQRHHGDEMRYSRSLSYNNDRPFEWYNGNRVEMIDDFEEKLRPGYNRPNYYDDLDFCSRVLECSKVKADSKKSKCSKNKSRSSRSSSPVSDKEEREVIYVVKKKGKD